MNIGRTTGPIARWWGSRIRPWLLACVVVSVLFACSSVVTQTIVAMLAWHFLILALPFLAAVFNASRRGVADPVILALWGVAVSGVCAYLSFWYLFFDPSSGCFVIIAMLGVAVVVACRSGVRLNSAELRICRNLLVPFAFCIAYAAALLIVALAPSGAIDAPLEAVRSRFSYPLPADNALPLLFARNVLSNNYPSPMLGDWLGSDRPPLQSGYFLMSTLGLDESPWSGRLQDLSYQVQGTLLQTFWLAGMWFLLDSMKIRRAASLGAMAICAISGFSFVHGIFVWPKLLPVAPLALIVALIFRSDRVQLSDPRVGALVGCSAALALLCHGGSFFALAGLGIYALINRRIPTLAFLVAAAGTAIALLLPWSLYQHYFDPPGDRLLKWHLAGVVDVDARSFSSALKDAYRAMPWGKFLLSKAADVGVLFGVGDAWPWLQAKSLALQLSTSEILRLRGSHFSSLMATLGFFAWVPLVFAFLFRRFKGSEALAGGKLLSLSMLVVVIWILAMYEPGSTTLHQGSLAVVGFSLAGCFLLCLAWTPKVAWLLLAAQLVSSFVLYLLPRQEGGLLDPVSPALPMFDGAFAAGFLLVAVAIMARGFANEVGTFASNN